MKKKMLLMNRRKKDHQNARDRFFGNPINWPAFVRNTLQHEVTMENDESAASKSYDRARDMAEKALDAYVEGDDKKGGELVERAKAVNETAVRDVHEELEEDSASEHDPKKVNESISKNRSG